MFPSSNFEGTGEMSHLRHLAQPEEVAVLQDTPMLEPFWAAGMSFSRGHFVARFDGHSQPSVLQRFY